MRWLMSEAEFRAVTSGARVLERDRHGDKVLLLPDDRIIKLFRIKRLFSLALVYPYSLRFARNARGLARRGFSTVVVERVFYCHAIARHGVLYPLLPGSTLLSLLRESMDEALMQELAAYIAKLHRSGVYFRSLHLGNVLRLEQGGLGLIDVADLRFRRASLSVAERARNFRHLLRNTEHLQLLQGYGVERLVEDYLATASADLPDSGKLRDAVLAVCVEYPARK